VFVCVLISEITGSSYQVLIVSVEIDDNSWYIWMNISEQLEDSGKHFFVLASVTLPRLTNSVISTWFTLMSASKLHKPATTTISHNTQWVTGRPASRTRRQSASYQHDTKTIKMWVSQVYPEWYLQIFSTPDVHARVVRTYLIEVVAVDGKQTASHRRSSVIRRTFHCCY